MEPNGTALMVALDWFRPVPVRFHSKFQRKLLRESEGSRGSGYFTRVAVGENCFRPARSKNRSRGCRKAEADES